MVGTVFAQNEHLKIEGILTAVNSRQMSQNYKKVASLITCKKFMGFEFRATDC
jgi:hypothetical protein